MALASLFCHVRQSHVTVVTDLEGGISRLICPDYDESTGVCRIRIAARGGGPLSQLLERLDEGDLNDREARCALLAV